MAAKVAACPTCNASGPLLVPHCESRNCDWLCCHHCKSWGKKDLSSWVSAKEAS